MADLLASVVVAVRGDTRARRLLASLASQTVPREQYEVLVVENGSKVLAGTDGAYGITRYAHLTRGNSAAARNTGLGMARGRFVLLTDADCVARAGWVEAMTACLARGEVAAADGKRYVLDTYPLRRVIQAAVSVPGCAVHLLRGDPGPASAAVLQLIEAAGVFCGDISGAIRFRQPYL